MLLCVDVRQVRFPRFSKYLLPGTISRPGTAHVVLGQAYTEIQQYRKALDAFALAQRYDNNSRKIARGWIDYVRDRMNAASTQSGP